MEPWQLLDGRTRLDALAVLPDAERLITQALANGLHLTLDEKKPETDPWAFSKAANYDRRHLTREQLHEQIDAALTRDPSRSDRAIAEEIGTTHPTVAARRDKDLGDGGKVYHHDKRVGRDGVEQPAHKPPPSKEQQLRAMREQREKKAKNGKSLAPKIVSERQQADELLALLRRIDRDFEGLNLEAASRGLAGPKADEARAALALAEMRLAAVASVLGGK
jgi:hypothetical protein